MKSLEMYRDTREGLAYLCDTKVGDIKLSKLSREVDNILSCD